MCVCVCACVRACVRVCARACVCNYIFLKLKHSALNARMKVLSLKWNFGPIQIQQMVRFNIIHHLLTYLKFVYVLVN